MFDKNQGNLNTKLILCLTAIFAFFVYITFFKVNLLMFDDAIYACIVKPYASHLVLNNFITDTATEHYQFLAVFLSKFSGTILPEILGYHPQDFVMHFAHYIKAVFYIISIFAMTIFTFTDKNKNNILFPIVFLFMFFITIINTMTFTPATFSLYSAFFRFQIPLIYLSLFLYYFIKDYLDNRINHKNTLTALFILNILDGNEITIVLIQLFLLLLLIMNIKKHGLNSILNFLISNKLLCALYITFPFVKLLLTAFTNRYNGDLLSLFNFNIIREFSIEYIKFIFCNHLIFFAVFLIVFAVYTVKIRNTKIIQIISSLFISLLIFLYSLILYGKVNLIETEEPVFLLSHWHLQANADIILTLLIIFLLIRLCEKYAEFKKITAILLFSVSFYIFILMNYFDNGKYTFTKKGLYYNERKVFYKFEKSFLELIKTHNGSVYLRYEPTDTIDIFNLKYIMFYYYIAGIYKLNPDNFHIQFVTNDIAEQKLKETGITFSEQELNNTRFKDLYDILK